MLRASVLVFVLAACGGSSKPPVANTSKQVAAADQCAPAADHVVDLMSAMAKDAPPERVTEFKQSFVQHCRTDKWSADMQRCVIDAKKQDDFEKCDQFMTAEQKAALSKEDADEGGGGAGGAKPEEAPPAPTAQPAAAAPPPPLKQDAKKSAADKSKSRGPVKKGGDPCEGGQ